METKANTAVIGAFTLAVIAFAFGFIYWLADSGISKESMTVVFRGQVAGLEVGSDVYFNGIPVGDVRALQFDENVHSSCHATPTNVGVIATKLFILFFLSTSKPGIPHVTYIFYSKAVV